MSHNTHTSAGHHAKRRLYAPTVSPRLCRGFVGMPNYSFDSAGTSTGANPRQSRGLSSFRRGISLTEVLIAMGILTVGLLGVASIFPVASFYMQQGDVADRGSQIAQSAFNDAVARGTLDPANWLLLEDATGVTNGIYAKRFAPNLRNQLAVAAGSSDAPLQKHQKLNRAFGSVYVIDPLGVDSSPLDPDNSMDRRQARIVATLPFNAKLSSYAYQAWWPWNPALATPEPMHPNWPVVRVTLPEVSPGPSAVPNWPMRTVTADRLFRTNDDLAIDVPARADRPSQQMMTRFDVDGNGELDAISRQSKGDYSWLITVVPSSTDARNALAIDPSSFSYEVSVAVFYKRILDNLVSDSIPAERLTTAKIVSTGLNGGEILIQKESGDTAADPFGALKVGRWMLVCGPSPNSSSERPQFVARWYNVLSISDEVNGVLTDSTTQRLVSLRGPQWPWQPAADLTTAALSNSLCGVIVPNVVAVHSKTIKLGAKSAWSMQ
jgi:hypothetical protein